MKEFWKIFLKLFRTIYFFYLRIIFSKRLKFFYFIQIGEEVEILGMGKKTVKTTVTGIETFKKTLDYGEAGDNVGLLLRGIGRDDIKRG